MPSGFLFEGKQPASGGIKKKDINFPVSLSNGCIGPIVNYDVKTVCQEVMM